jgi:hypothetical protein
MRRFPPPWTVEAIDAGFKVIDANGQALAYVYGYANPRDAGIANAMTLDEARRIASRRGDGASGQSRKSLTWAENMRLDLPVR